MISFQAQALEIELHFLGLRDIYNRASSGKIKRSPEETERLKRRVAVAEAAAHTLRTIADEREARTVG